MTDEQRQMIKLWFEKHQTEVGQERDKYYKHKTKAKLQPEKYRCMIIDGMGSNVQSIPHNRPRRSDAPTIADMHLVGVIDHQGEGKMKKYVFVVEEEVAHDCNLTLTCLLHVLNFIAEDMPPVLYLQV
jgi:hypothetical protein